MRAADIEIEKSLYARQRHLSLLGVNQWYSRYSLLRAGKTPDALFSRRAKSIEKELVQQSQFSGPDESDNSHFSASTLGKESLESFTELLSPSSANLSDQDQKGEVGGVDERGANVADLDLSLCLLSANETLIFYEGQASGTQTKEHDLLRAFLKFALGDKGVVFDSSIFDWPVFSSVPLRVDQLRYFNQSMSRWASKPDWSKVNYVFYFGYKFDVLEPLLLDIKIAADSECVFVPMKISIADLLGAPIKKRGLWESIVALPKR